MSREFPTSGSHVLTAGTRKFPQSEATIVCWFYPTWSSHSDGLTHRVCMQVLDGSNYFALAKTAADNFVAYWYTAGSAYFGWATPAQHSFTMNAWNSCGCSWRQGTGGAVYVHMNGAYRGTGGIGPQIADLTGATRYIGNNAATTIAAGGYLAEWTVYDWQFSTAEIARVHRREHPRRFGMPDQYIPMYGASSPEPEYSGNADSCTVTGTNTKQHPPIQRHMVTIPRLHTPATPGVAEPATGEFTALDCTAQVDTEEATAGIATGEWVALDCTTPGLPIAAITLRSSTASRMAPHAVHVHATASTVTTWRRAKFEWDFGESGQITCDDPRPSKTGTFDLATDQKGFNAAYIYQTSGTKTVTLTVTDEDGRTDTDSVQVTIGADTRAVRYVDATGGDNGNDGTSPAEAWQTIGYAHDQLTDNMRLRLKRGETFNTTVRIDPTEDNLVIDDYDSGAIPIVRWSGGNPPSEEILLYMRGAAENFILKNVHLQTNSILNGSQVVAVEPSGNGQAVWNCTIDGTISPDQGFKRQCNISGDGILILNTDLGQSDAYCFALAGDDIVIAGSTCLTSRNEHCLRHFGTNRVNLLWVDFDHEERSKNTLSLNAAGQFTHVGQSRLVRGKFTVSHDENGAEHVTFDQNYFGVSFNTAVFFFTPRCSKVLLRNNVFDMDGTKQIFFGRLNSTYTGAYDTENVEVYNNTFLIDSVLQGSLIMKAQTVAPQYQFVDTRIRNNLFVINSFPGGKNLLDIEDLIDANGNVFRDFGTDQVYKIEGTSYDFDGYLARADVSDEAEENVAIADVSAPDFRPDAATYPTASTQANPIDGVWEDYNGDSRPSVGTWYAGASDSGQVITVPAVAEWVALDAVALVSPTGYAVAADAELAALDASGQVDAEEGTAEIATGDFTALDATAAVSAEEATAGLAAAEFDVLDLTGEPATDPATATPAAAEFVALDCTTTISAEEATAEIATAELVALDATGFIPAKAEVARAEFVATDATTTISAEEATAEIATGGWAALDATADVTAEEASAEIAGGEWVGLDAWSSIGVDQDATIATSEWVALDVDAFVSRERRPQYVRATLTVRTVAERTSAVQTTVARSITVH